jgi:hypothetical protein
MFSPIPRPPISQRRKAVALAVAGAVDMLQMFIVPLVVEGAASPVEDVLDVFAAVVLTAICGFKWQFVLAFFMELVPGLDILPTWSAVALLIPSSASGGGGVVRAEPPVQGKSGSLPPIEVTATVVPPVQGLKR